MRIITRTQFLALPAGILFMKWPIEDGSPLAIKKETIGSHDYFELDLGLPTPVVNGESLMPTDEVPENVSFQLEYAVQRDGLFDQEQQYCIYEQADVVQFLDLLQKELLPEKQ